MQAKSRWLITGGAGFIGSHLVERLLKEGHFVRVLDNFSTGKEENLPYSTLLAFISPYNNNHNSKGNNTTISPDNFELIRGDIRDYATCLQTCEDIDYVLHQAALRSVPKSMETPHEYNEVNIDGTVNILQAAKEKGVKRLVFASSSSIYGDTDIFPEKEEHLPKILSPYGLTKLAGEHYCRIFSESFGLETVCLRYFNVFGPRQALDDEYAVVIPKFIHCILNDEQPPIFGTGKQSRDFTYIDNVVEANILAATTPNLKYEIFNVANGKNHTVLQLVEILTKIIGKNIKPQFLPPRPGDAFKTLADINEIKKTLGFKSKVNFEAGLEKTVKYFKKQLVMIRG